MSDKNWLPAADRLRPLCKDGPEIGAIAWGMWRFQGSDVAAATRLVETALDSGMTLLDTADIYGPDNDEPFGASEALLGRVLADAPELRQRMLLATKGGIEMGTPYNSSAEYIEFAVDASLKRLGCDHVDLWQVHRPDVLVHPEILAETLGKLVQSGKIGAVGVSNFTTAQISALNAYLDIPLASTQPEFSPLSLKPLENGEFDQAMELGLTTLAWSPLGGGRISDPQSGRERQVATALDDVAAQFGVTRAAAAFSWIMAHPARPIPIVGSQTPARIAEAGQAYDVRWTRQSWYQVLTAARGVPLP